MSAARYLGIDAGASKTVCLVGDAERVIGRGVAGPANPVLVGIAGFRRAVAASAEAALGGDKPEIVMAWLGVAGSGALQARSELVDAAREALGTQHVTISHDARLLPAAAGLSAGLAIVAGTGCSAYGVDEAGTEASAGGWGHLLVDEGGAYDIALRGLRAVAAQSDGRGPATLLTSSLPAAAGIADVAGLRAWAAAAHDVPAVARLAEEVLRAAESDPVAGAIVDGAAEALVRTVRACHDQLRFTAHPIPVVFAGGLVGRESPLASRLAEHLARAGPYRPVPLTVEPAVGALALARAGPASAATDPGATSASPVPSTAGESNR